MPNNKGKMERAGAGLWENFPHLSENNNDRLCTHYIRLGS